VSTLAVLCEDEKLGHWLRRTGGFLPRGWLKSATPLVVQYLKQEKPISARRWERVREKSPPPLLFREEDECVITGWRRVDDLSEGLLAILRYLHAHRDRVCTREELFHKAYRPVHYPDSSELEHHIEYDASLDTALSWLREKVEPDPRSPIYVVTVRGEGYQLKHAW
jgi:DNA-binding winged helix-turn-helix (wHTH) protein